MDKLNRSDPSAPYLQIVNAVRQAIVDGEYEPGDPLPSKSQLAGWFGVSLMTVQNALRVLREEGVVNTHVGTGTFVATVPPRKERDYGAELDALRARVDDLETLVADLRHTR